MKITPNIGSTARFLYVLAGVVLIGLALLGPFPSAAWAVIVGLLGAITVFEGAVGF